MAHDGEILVLSNHYDYDTERKQMHFSSCANPEETECGNKHSTEEHEEFNSKAFFKSADTITSSEQQAGGPAPLESSRVMGGGEETISDSYYKIGGAVGQNMTKKAAKGERGKVIDGFIER